MVRDIILYNIIIMHYYYYYYCYTIVLEIDPLKELLATVSSASATAAAAINVI